MKKLTLITVMWLLTILVHGPPLSWTLYAQKDTYTFTQWKCMYESKQHLANHYEQILYEREMDLYACHLGWYESRMNWKAINKYGYMGTWQHGRAILKDFGLDIRPDDFRRDPSIFPPELQYKVIIAQIKTHQIRLRKYEAYVGHTIGGVFITHAGLLAGCHLGGFGGVTAFLYSNGSIDRSDRNGTKVSDYIKEFSIYNL